MILIISNNNDQVTGRICTWLRHYQQDFRLVCSKDIIKFSKISTTDAILENETRSYSINLNRVRVMLYRQGNMNVYRPSKNLDNRAESNYFWRDWEVLQNYLYYKLSQIPHLGHPQHSDLNKLVLLEQAKVYGLKVPEYIFTNSKSELIRFKSKHSNIISKTIQPGFQYASGKDTFAIYTEIISDADIAELSEQFYPTFFQKQIPKKIEVRVFYMDSKFYSIAIISQNNVRTAIDYRIYDNAVPNRNIPFKIPNDLEKRLQELINHLNLRYCSIDFIYDLDNEFHFLEINPIGQFGNVSYYGNYLLEKQMAKILCKRSE